MTTLKITTKIVIFFFCFSQVFGQRAEDVVIEAEFGPVEGRKLFSETKSRFSFFGFLGIPYAEAPIGEFRFRDPIPFGGHVRAHDRPFNATQFGPQCPQIETLSPTEFGEVVGDEDCLYLNVFTPILPKPNFRSESVLKPVMIFIHGGGFTSGSGSSYAPDFFVERDVVFVTFNYRLGPLGFLSLSNSLVSGNMGLKDQLVAFEWVARNIASFGGDPDRVTIFGQSAGAISVHAHILSPKGDGLYRAAIMQSGSILSLNEIHRRRSTEEAGKKFVRRFACGGRGNRSLDLDVGATLRCLQSLPASDIVRAVQVSYNVLEAVATELENPELGVVDSFLPTVDHYSDDPFMPVTPLLGLMQRTTKSLPLLAGVTAQEGAFYLAGVYDRLDELQQEWKFVAPKIGLGVNPSESSVETTEWANRVRRFYLNDSDFSIRTKWDMLDMISDVSFVSATFEAAQFQSAVNDGSNVFFYELLDRPVRASFSAFFARGTGFERENFGAAHSDDLLFQFPGLNQVRAIQGRSDEEISETIVSYWTNFAKFGDPSPFRSRRLPFWPEMRPGEPAKVEYLEIAAPKTTPRTGFHPGRMRFMQRAVWDPAMAEVQNLVDYYLELFHRNIA